MIQQLKNWLNALQIDFVRFAWPAAIVSTLAMTVAWVVFLGVGPNWGIDFTGGTEIYLKFEQDTSISEVRSALREIGLADDTVQQVNDVTDNEFSIRIQDATFGSEELRAEVETKLKAEFGEDWIDHVRFDAEVGARLSVYYTGDIVLPQTVQALLADMDGVVVQEGRDDKQIDIKMPGLASQVEQEIRTVMGDRAFEVLSIDAVGPKVGGELRRQGFISVMATLELILIYVAFRFDITFAPGAVLALFHDVSLTVMIFVLTQREFNLPMIGALLTIVGYSLNDTIVIYDRIRENSERHRRTEMKDLINVSINETLSRTLATSLTTFLAIAAFLFMGGPVIQNFAFALLLGIIFGTYSTIFVASPTILVMQRVRPHLNRLVAGAAAAEEAEADEQSTDLTQAEQRRRERAQHESSTSA
jgi:preprotein translocase subunit SecF